FHFSRPPCERFLCACYQSGTYRERERAQPLNSAGREFRIIVALGTLAKMVFKPGLFCWGKVLVAIHELAGPGVKVSGHGQLLPGVNAALPGRAAAAMRRSPPARQLPGRLPAGTAAPGSAKPAPRGRWEPAKAMPGPGARHLRSGPPTQKVMAAVVSKLRGERFLVCAGCVTALHGRIERHH